MNLQKIEFEGEILALFMKCDDWEPGLNFISDPDDFLQVGMWSYDKGKNLQAHIHLHASRQVTHTQEFLFVKNGSVRADIYTRNGQKVRSIIVKTGDFLVLLQGGHGYEILDDTTQVIEVKNGPYIGLEQDRKRFSS